MSFHRKAIGLALAAALAAGALLAPAAASAKTYAAKWTLTGNGTSTSGTVTGTVKGTPFGSGKASSQILPPLTKDTYTLKGGTLKVDWNSTLEGSIATGTWKVVGGTGKFKHAKGTGKVSGDIAKGVFNYSGKLSY